MLIIKLAVRNIFSHLRKNIIIVSVTAIVSFFLFLFLTFSDGEIENVKKGVSSFYSPRADAYIVHKDFRSLQYKSESDDSAESTAFPVSTITEIVQHIEGVKEVFPTYWRVAADMFVEGEKYLDFGIVGIAQDDSNLLSKFKVIDGSEDWYKADISALTPILVHKTLKNTTNIKAGDELTLVGNDIFNQITTKKGYIAGFIDPLQDNVNMYNMMLIPNTHYASYIGYSNEEANKIFVRYKKGIKDKDILPRINESLKEAGLDLDVYSEQEEMHNDPWLMVFKLIRIIVVVATLLVLFITAFGIMNVTSTNLAERKKEIGTYYCLGTEVPFLMSLYTLEIFVVNFAGSCLGIAFGLIGRVIINALKITSSNPGFLIVVGGSHLYLGLSLSTIMWILGGISILTILTALTTLGKGLRVSPVVAIKETEQ